MRDDRVTGPTCVGCSHTEDEHHGSTCWGTITDSGVQLESCVCSQRCLVPCCTCPGYEPWARTLSPQEMAEAQRTEVPKMRAWAWRVDIRNEDGRTETIPFKTEEQARRFVLAEVARRGLLEIAVSPLHPVER